ncbi:ABC transporter permease [Dethiosulfatarculus sandiegensis]|uniref:Peptide ABC transporter permease n=1 Tax=Dethiosulfatarculus sandiegensis TaxID=1429043 RepID=A0A0D2GM46_9BACT|nr:ABC transporter permease [Dethiosulfatarculus sandiegensis]KIX15782.1 peptide ABC transporter permease [Dethiosulfatarculus sandiegensis]
MISPQWIEFWQEFRESKSAMFGLFLTVLFIIVAVFASVLSPQNPYDLTQLFLENSNLAPTLFSEWSYSHFMLGSDGQGRDLYSAILYGLRVSLYVGLASTILSAAFGTLMGLVAGYMGGRTDAFIMRIADIQLSFPAILIALVIMSIWGQGLFKIIIAISVVNWVFYARTARGSTLAEREKDYVDAARSSGISDTAIMLREVLPNIVAPIIVIGTVRVANSIILESTLSFLGLGVPITEPSLGSLIYEGYQVLFSGFWWASVLPGLALMGVVLGINLLGDRLRDVLNPRLKR